MNKDLFFNGEKFISAKRAAEETGYAPDHVAALARDSKVLAKRVGRTWYVSEKSILAYKKGQPVNAPQHLELTLTPEAGSQTNSKDLYFNGEKFISSVDAAKLVGYAADHVAALARKGLVSGKMMGRTWYVSRAGILAHKRGKRTITYKKAARPVVKREVAPVPVAAPKLLVAEIAPIPAPKPIEIITTAQAVTALPIAREEVKLVGPSVFDSFFNQAVIAVVSVFVIGLSGTYILGASAPEMNAAFNTRLADAGTASVLGSFLDRLAGKPAARTTTTTSVAGQGPANESSITAILDGLPATVPAPLAVEKLKADLKAEIDAYAKSRLATEVKVSAPVSTQAPITIAFNQTVFKTEVLLAANAHTSAQSESDVDLLSKGLSSLKTNGTFVNPTIVGGSLSGVQLSGTFSGSASLTDLAFGNASGTNATTTNFFAEMASSTNLFTAHFSAGDATLGTAIIGNSTTTNATTTSLFAANASSTNLYATNGTVGALNFGNAVGSVATTTNLFSHVGIFDDVYVNNYQQNNGTFTINSTVPTGDIFSVIDAALTNGTLIHQSLTANAGNGEISKGQIIDLLDNTTAGGGYSALTVNVTGSGIGSGVKTLLDLNPGANKEIVFDSTGALRPTVDASQNITSIGTPSYYFKNGYFDTITANNISGTVITGSTAATTWTVGSTQTGDVNEAIVFQRNSGSGNALLSWNASSGTLNDQRFLSVNYPFNATYTVNDASIATSTSLYSGLLTNNTTSGTQKLLSLTNTGTGTTEDGIYVNNTGTGLNAIEIAGTWAKGIVTNNNSVDIGTGGLLFGNATGTNATTTNFYATNATLGNLNLANLVFQNATGTSLFATTASTTNLFAAAASINGSAFNVTSGGNVGIGITNPSAKLTVAGGDIAVTGSTNGITFANNQSIRDGGASGDLTIFTPTTGAAINFNTTNGNIVLNPGTMSVGIGTSTPNGMLQVARDVGALPTSSVYGQLELTLTSNPTSRLSAGYSSTFDAGFLQAISGSVNKSLLLNPQGGNVGIGITNPFSAAKLHVAGEAFVSTSDFASGSAGTGIAITPGSSTGNTYGAIQVGNAGYTAVAALSLNPSGGNVGIGTTTPLDKLDVAGSMWATGAIYANSTKDQVTTKSLASKTIYVDASAGNDSTGVGTSGNPYKTIARALADVPDVMLHDYTIQLAPGTYREAVAINQRGATINAANPGASYTTLTIVGNGASPDSYRITGANVGADTTAVRNFVVAIDSTVKVKLEGVRLDYAIAAGVYVPQESTVLLKNVNIVGTPYGVRMGKNSFLDLRGSGAINITGTGSSSGAGIYIEGYSSLMADTGTTITVSNVQVGLNFGSGAVNSNFSDGTLTVSNSVKVSGTYGIYVLQSSSLHNINLNVTNMDVGVVAGNQSFIDLDTSNFSNVNTAIWADGNSFFDVDTTTFTSVTTNYLVRQQSVVDATNESSTAKLLTSLSGASSAVNGATAVAYDFDTQNSLTTTGAKLFRLSNAGTELFTVDKSGNVGIGTTTPSSKLVVNGTALAQAVNVSSTLSTSAYLSLTHNGTFGGIQTFNATPLRMQNGGGGSIYLDTTTNVRNSLNLVNASDVALLNITDGTTYREIQTQGSVPLVLNDQGNNVGIGKTNPSTALDVVGTASSTGLQVNGTAKVGAGSVVQTSDGAGSSFAPQLMNSQTSGVAGVGVGVNDGTNNRRLALFVDQTNAIAGISTSYSSGAFPFVFRDAGGERLRIDTAGNVGVGTTNPLNKLSVLQTSVGAESIPLFLANRDSTASTAVAIGFSAESTGATTGKISNVRVGSSDYRTDFYNYTSSLGVVMSLYKNSLGVGTTSPSATFAVQIPNSSTNGVLINGSSNSNYSLTVSNGGGNARGVSINGGTSSGSAASLLTVNSNTGATNFFTVTNGTSYFQNGNVGIGTTTPQSLLSVYGDMEIGAAGAGNPTIRAYNANRASNGYVTLYNSSTGSITLGTTFSSGSVILSPGTSGNVGIGITNPAPTTLFGGGKTLEINDSLANIHLLSGTNNASFGVDASLAYLESDNGWRIYSGGSERMRITSTGNVGIGTTNPNSLGISDATVLSLINPTNNSVASSSAVLEFGFQNSVRARVGAIKLLEENTNSDSGKFVFTVPNGSLTTTDALTILGSNGNVGIGITNPGAKLQVSVSTAAEALRLQTSYDASLSQRAALTWADGSNVTGAIDTRYDGTSVNMYFGSLYNSGYNTNSLMVLKGNGNLGIGTTSPVVKFETWGPSGLPANSGTSQTAISRLAQSGNSVVLDMGVNATSPFGGWLQSTSRIDLSQTYPLTLQPNGGSVGIGTTNPGAKLQINGNSTDGWIKLSTTAGNPTIVSTNDIDFITANSVHNLYLQGSTGNVGIGSTNPSGARLVISSGVANVETRLSDRALSFTRASDGAVINTITSDPTNENLTILARSNLYLGTNGGTSLTIVDGAGGAGNIGIGTTNPGNYKLKVIGATYASGTFTSYTADGLFGATALPSVITTPSSNQIRFGYSDNGAGAYVPKIGFYQATSGTVTGAQNSIGNDINGDFVIGVGASNAERMRITSGGNVGIGTTNPNDKLEISGDLRVGNGTSEFHVGNSGRAFAFNRNTSTGAVFSNTGYAYQLNHTGVSTTAASDYLAWQVYDQNGSTVTSNALVINGAGNIGIGTTNPTGYSNFVGLTIGDNSASKTGFLKFSSTYNSGNGAEVYQNTSGTINFNVNSASTAMSITSVGNVGIGVTNPGFKLTVAGEISGANTVLSTGAVPADLGSCFSNGLASTIALGSGVAVGDVYFNSTRGQHRVISTVTTCNDGGSGRTQIQWSNTITGNTAGDSYAIYTNTSDIGDTSSGFVRKLYAVQIFSGTASFASSFDLAENYPTFDASLAPGEVVAVNPALQDYVQRSSGKVGDLVLGVISTDPAITLGSSKVGAWKSVALSGRVPVKISDENGAVRAGDFLAPASVPGKVAKAVKAGLVLGQALGDEQGGQVSMFVNRFFYDPAAATTTASTTSERVASLEIKVSALESLLSATSSALTLDVTSSEAVASSFFAEASLALRQGIQALGQVSIIHNAVYAVAGIFDKIFAKSVHTDLICVTDTNGETCVNRSQLDSMLAASGQSGTISGVAPVTNSNTDTASSTAPTDTASSTPATDTASSTPATETTSTSDTNAQTSAQTTDGGSSATSTDTVASASDTTSVTP